MMANRLTNNANKQINLQNVDAQLEVRRLKETIEVDMGAWEPLDIG